MKTFDIKMPKLGESITEGTIIAWSVKVGDVVNEDDLLFEVTTAKVSAEIPSPVSGTVLEILTKEGDTVSVGTVVMLMNIDGDTAPAPETRIDGRVEPIAQDPQAGSDTVTVQHPTEVIEPHPTEPKEARWYSPVVLQKANEANIAIQELDTIQGSGYLGRLSKRDIQNYIAQKASGVTRSAVNQQNAAAPTPQNAAAPTLQNAAAPTLQTSSLPQNAAAPTPQTSSLPISGEDQIVEMDPVRRIIADHMVMSRRTSAHVTTFIEVDVTKLVEWRKRNKDQFLKHEGVALTYMPAIVEASASALIAYPQVNASVDGHRIILKKHINIGIAVALDNWNLIVPVVHDADKMSISGLAQTMDTLANSARANKLKIDNIQGGTFTITNFGSFKNIMGTPIINQPEVAILGVGYIEKKPAVLETADGDVIAIRHKMMLSLSYDHRVVDGALGGNFLLHIAKYLENWNR